MAKFNRLDIPATWERYWSKYPQGYTIMEALINWVNQVNHMTDNVNDWNDYLNQFVETFDTKMQGTVRDMVQELYDRGQFAELTAQVIDAVQDQITDITTQPSGTSGDLTKLQNAINDTPTGGKLTLKQGETYTISGRLDLKSDIWIDGNGATIIQTLSNEPILWGVGLKNVTIKNLKLKGVGTDYTKTSINMARGIYLNGDPTNKNENITIESCEFDNFSFGAICLYHSYNFEIKNNKIKGTATYHDNVLFNDNYQFGIWLGSHNYVGIISQNEVSGTAIGIYNGYYAYNLKYSQNYIHDIPAQHGGYLSHGVNVTFIDNTIERCALNGVKLQHADNSEEISKHVLFSLNKIRDCGDTGIALLQTGTIQPYHFYNVQVTHNEISNCNAGITAHTLHDSLIAFNQILNDVSFINEDTANGKYGIFLASITNTTIEGNMINRTNWNGIFVAGTTNDVNIIKNEVYEPAQAQKANNDSGIYMTHGSNITVDGNVVKDSNKKMLYSFFMLANVTGAKIRNNRFLDVACRLQANAIPKEWDNNEVFFIAEYPQNVVKGQKATVYHGTSANAPTTNEGYLSGDRYEYNNPVPGGYIGRVLISTTWKEYGAISQ